MINAVVFGVGETLVDETQEYGTWADWLGVPRHTFSSVFGAVIALGTAYREGAPLMARDVKIPDASYPITVKPTGSHVTVRVGGVTVAESRGVLREPRRGHRRLSSRIIPNGPVSSPYAGYRVGPWV